MNGKCKLYDEESDLKEGNAFLSIKARRKTQGKTEGFYHFLKF